MTKLKKHEQINDDVMIEMLKLTELELSNTKNLKTLLTHTEGFFYKYFKNSCNIFGYGTPHMLYIFYSQNDFFYYERYLFVEDGNKFNFIPETDFDQKRINSPDQYLNEIKIDFIEFISKLQKDIDSVQENKRISADSRQLCLDLSIDKNLLPLFEFFKQVKDKKDLSVFDKINGETKSEKFKFAIDLYNRYINKLGRI